MVAQYFVVIDQPFDPQYFVEIFFLRLFEQLLWILNTLFGSVVVTIHVEAFLKSAIAVK